MTILPAAAPRLTRLELQGFKSFAVRTVFAFEPGITAVVGPNGSGKSNISDAVRWVLGEQSYNALRGKKTEDVIFAGGNGRAPAGVAEAAVTFDNSARWLPTDFTEVTITRRAYRGGENQYLINGRKVRLKDIAHLTASLGQSHTVVGQGLVDAALSQRAEERRALFEHAADLTGLRLKAAEAERSLAETHTNSARLADLLAELAPRLRTLERAARQANEWRDVHARLQALQRAHYRRLLHAATARLAATETAAGADERVAHEAQAAVAHLLAKRGAAETAAERARTALTSHDTSLQQTLDQARRLAHERDLTTERHAALARRREDMADTRAGLDEQATAVAATLAALDGELATLDAEVAAARQAVAARQADGAAARKAREQLDQRAAALLRTIADGERRLTDLARRRALLEQRGETDAAERERLAAAGAERGERLGRLEAELTAFADAEATDAATLTALDRRLAALAAEAEHAASAAQAARAAVTEAERRLGQATTRLDVLQRLHESGTGLYTGVRATLQAAHAGQLAGIRGTVAELIDAPAEYDTAIEVALGGHLQDVVVARWADAEAAILYLKRSNAGRATFQPLDTVRGRDSARALPREALNLHGVRGVAADLVRAAPELGGVLTSLLGRTLVVVDLTAARVALRLLPNGWSAVTLAGEIARAGGSVTGGAAVRESGVLTRERELRELPSEIRRLERAQAAAVAAQETAASAPRRIAQERQQVEAERAGQVAARRERQTQQKRLAAWRDELRVEQTAAERRLAALGAAAATAQRDLATLTTEEAQGTAAVAAGRAEQETVQADLKRAAGASAAGEQRVAAEQRRLAGLDERLRAERRRRADLQTQQRALAGELTLRAERTAALDRELATLAAQHERLTREVAALDASHQAALAERPPLEAALREVVTAAAQLARELDAARERLVEVERAHGASNLAAERARDDLAAIRQRITDDLEMENPSALLADEEPEDDAGADPAATEREIARLRERLRRVGYVGEDVVAEYEREAQHHEFLRGQLVDVEAAAASLRGLLAELQETMRVRFDATFARVAEVFTENFTTLFGGGTARLVMAPGEDGGAGGVDIVAQPPGKRLQSLGLLSGGERALTAVALLFAILRVNPSPFCLLDEVDAALDEANVVRFREQLQTLAAETQMIVITHNRGTIEIADTLYGVSMRDDGVSQVLSLRLPEAVAAAT